MSPRSQGKYLGVPVPGADGWDQPVDDGDLDSLPQHDVVQKLCATLDDAFAALGHYSDQDGYAPFSRLTPVNRGLKRFLERYDRLSPDEWTEQEAQAVEYAASVGDDGGG